VSLGDKVISHNCLFKHSIARTIDNFLWNVGNYEGPYEIPAEDYLPYCFFYGDVLDVTS